MKWISVIIAVSLFACNGKTKNTESEHSDPAAVGSDTLHKPADEHLANPSPRPRLYFNKRFRDVTVQRAGDNTFVIEGEAQIFEANFGWVVEDGHRELKKGFEMTDAGAPEWGEFKFTIEVEKARPNSTLTLVLFESSAKDGSRQHELPISLALPISGGE